MSIRQLTLPVESPQIEINGVVFDLQMSDLDIFSRAQELFNKFQKYNKKTMKEFPLDEVVADCKEAAGFLDEMLGAGATYRISGGKPVCFATLLQWVTLVSADAATNYSELVVRE